MTTRFFRYALPLADGRLREGILIRLENSHGEVGWGDAAPLHVWSAEDLEDVVAVIRAGDLTGRMPSSLQCAIEASSCSTKEHGMWKPKRDEVL